MTKVNYIPWLIIRIYLQIKSNRVLYGQIYSLAVEYEDPEENSSLFRLITNAFNRKIDNERFNFMSNSNLSINQNHAEFKKKNCVMAAKLACSLTRETNIELIVLP